MEPLLDDPVDSREGRGLDDCVDPDPGYLRARACQKAGAQRGPPSEGGAYDRFGARHGRGARQLTTGQGWSGAWIQTVLPWACRSAPHCRPVPSTIARPRPEVAWAGVRQGCGMRVLPSLTSTRTR
jgi:hypothetical protein